jgi:hypothetical protein
MGLTLRSVEGLAIRPLARVLGWAGGGGKYGRRIWFLHLRGVANITPAGAFSDFASISGGEPNTASGRASSVSGGFSNMASGNWSSVSGGQNRTALGPFNWVAGALFSDN